MTTVTRLAIGSILIGLLVLGLKLAAFWVTGSVALYSDALESIVNVAAAGAALVAIRLSAMPADINHPYGHHKAEYFAAVLEGVLIVVAALSIARAAYGAILDPQEPEALALGLALAVVAGVINAVWAGVLVRAGTKHRSPALVADGRHLQADVASSIAVVGGVSLAYATGWAILDPILALAVAIHILWSGWGLVKSSIGGLMDEAVAPEELARIHARITDAATGALEAHDLRTRRAGRVTFIDFHLVVPGALPVSDAHAICDRIEAGLRAEVGEAVITIHVEPEDKAKGTGVLVL
ncbi:cation diffusion facilitator family transporter [Salinarimonas sp.]|uniref:cation diffusion facilitator family transporter n=1 Tax=Salinarimonas sp. TaxID=2766526 RepID=UPI00391D3C52